MADTARAGTAPADPALFAGMANAIRALAMDAVEQAKSGHPGMPMGMADVATTLFARFMKLDAAAPDWPDRDRFILSAGHGSMLIYALGWLLGYEGMDLDQIRNFRQLGFKTAGHPEYGHAPLVETTTGPLGQGLANAVGMAIAEAHLAARFGEDLVDHYTYVIAGDGCLMEGISHEAIALAGHLKLRKLIVLFDDNRISIDGPTALADSTDQLQRFAASGWATARVDGHDPEAVARALEAARESDRPSLIACRTVIGRGAPKKGGTAAAHGAPLGAEEIAAAREALGWPHPPFEIPDDILAAWREAGRRGRAAREAWRARLDASPQKDAFEAALKGDYAETLAGAIREYKKVLAENPPKVATRKASEMALEVVNAAIPDTVGGSADLTGSNNTKTKGLDVLSAENYAGRYLHYGVREHAMAAAMNGMALHGGVVPYGGTFLVFSDYCRPAIRLAALMGQRVVFVMTHDSIGLGEDGPTHQPVEHLAALRAIPNLKVFRPADAVETAECWELALASRDGPSVIALTRQNLAPARLAHEDENRCARGAYAIAEEADPDVVLIATGSEVEIALAAREKLAQGKIRARVVSAPSFELFRLQPEKYRARLLGKAPRVGVEAAVRQGWDLFLRRKDAFVGMTGFGASGKGPDLYAHFGIAADAVAKAAKKLID
ncbi:transketolase [Amphiplicatus metriothermophilus]|uniref:Transketolase n=1 Tax=Amphiplicatus metriothermophilus TaxID=1519374 RepID=A0A239PYC7_9PROT|nr:transketolase [Amphiplicatus metriothermophilus]MBB5518159.1 transketolase [Amphiplicatus metriothermophilus]SNT75321.1 transketolase [Amphiplicatus metriothermophilus]